MIRKNITITQEQAEFVKEKNINLSRLVQKVLDKDIDDWKFYQSHLKGLRDIKQGRYKQTSFDELREEIWRLDSQINSTKYTPSSTTKRKEKFSNKSKSSKKTPLLEIQ